MDFRWGMVLAGLVLAAAWRAEASPKGGGLSTVFTDRYGAKSHLDVFCASDAVKAVVTAHRDPLSACYPWVFRMKQAPGDDPHLGGE